MRIVLLVVLMLDVASAKPTKGEGPDNAEGAEAIGEVSNAEVPPNLMPGPIEPQQPPIEDYPSDTNDPVTNDGIEVKPDQRTVGAVNPESLAHAGEAFQHDAISEGLPAEVPVNDRPVGAIDPEHLVHSEGEDSVHEARSEENPVGVVNPELLLHADTGPHVHNAQDQGEKIPIGSVDPEQLVHDDNSHRDIHAKPEPVGSFHPESLVHGGESEHIHQQIKIDPPAGKGKGEVPGGGVGVGRQDDDLVHRLMHGEDPHEHPDPAPRMSAETLRQLNISPELLKNIDVDRLFQTIQEDYKEWQQEKSKDDVAVFEIMPDNLMEAVAKKYNLKEKGRILDPSQNDEWEEVVTDRVKLDPGEDVIMHRLELAGNTAPRSQLHQHKGFASVNHVHEEP